jgi:transposase
MGAPYSQDLRDRIIAAYDRGLPTAEIAATFCVSRAWARRVKQRLRDFDERGPRPPGPRHVVRKIDRVELARLVETHPDATVRELRDMLGVECSESGVHKALAELDYSYKKRRSTPRSRIDQMSRGDAACGVASSPASTHAG